jgi:hypothetical protein
MNSELYIAYFDTLGFECILSLTKHDKKAMWNVLSDKPQEKLPVYMMIMRAKANPQRFPEIWTFWSTVGLDALHQHASEMPQELANSIRSIGTKVFVTQREKEVIR